MLNYSEAVAVLQKSFPNADIRSSIVYQGLFIFQAFNPDLPFEEEMSPYFSVNRETGEFRDFSIIYDGNEEVVRLFIEAQGGDVIADSRQS